MALPRLRTWIDRRGADRTVPMKVLVLGLPRTGTASMTEALSMLGYNDVYHMFKLVGNPPDAEMWMEALQAKFSGQGKAYAREEWDQLLGHCQAVTDAPAMVFAKELIAAYPDAKVILTLREPESWWRSFTTTIVPLLYSRPVRLLEYIDTGLARLLPLIRLINLAVMGLPPKVTTLDAIRRDFPPERGVLRFEEHAAMIRALVPSENLLEYRPGDGWAPLCAFLGKEVPQAAYPQRNDAASFGEEMRAGRRRVWIRFLTRVGLPVGILCAAVAVGFHWRATWINS
ncbi:hypothetical protein MKEN_01494200 [Mycena kentingensis (nom. inval.)]|nr:hypothetical protein MKEN_01494200 [Mycena kentingensis (nom. inval.)]